MENGNIKRGRGRPKVFTDEELKKPKIAYLLNTEWFCDICKTGRNYTLAGRSNHLKTKMHNKNAYNILNKTKTKITPILKKVIQ